MTKPNLLNLATVKLKVCDQAYAGKSALQVRLNCRIIR